MLERTISGVVFVAVMVGGLLSGHLTGMIILLVLGLGCLWEFQKLLFDTTEPYFKVRRYSQLIVALFFFLAVNFQIDAKFFSDLNPEAAHAQDGWWRFLCACFLLGLCFMTITELFLKSTKPFVNLALWLFGLIYCMSPVLLLSHLAGNPTNYKPFIALAPFLLIWTNDTMAYLTGRALGRTPFFPRISPKKTWEGTIGGVVFTVALAALIGPKLGGWSQQGWIVAALIVGVFGTLGDLAESMLKRSVGVKDSGSIMPGHGGFLDRFDSFIFAMPLIWVFSPWLS